MPTPHAHFPLLLHKSARKSSAHIRFCTVFFHTALALIPPLAAQWINAEILPMFFTIPLLLPHGLTPSQPPSLIRGNTTQSFQLQEISFLCLVLVSSLPYSQGVSSPYSPLPRQVNVSLNSLRCANEENPENMSSSAPSAVITATKIASIRDEMSDDKDDDGDDGVDDDDDDDGGRSPSCSQESSTIMRRIKRLR